MRISEFGIVAVAAAFSVLVPDQVSGVPSEAAGLFAGGDALRFAAVVLAAFLLGMIVTVLCLRIKRHREERDDGL